MEILKEDSSTFNSQFHILAKALPEVIITIDNNSTILFINKSAEKIFGYKIEEMIGQKVIMLMPQDLRPVHLDKFSNYLKTGIKNISWESVKVPGLHQDGRIIPLEVSFIEFIENGIKLFTAFIRDISEPEKKEVERQESDNLIETIISSVKQGIITYDTNLNYKVWNKFMEELTGMTANQVIGKSAFELFPHLQENSIDEILKPVLKGKTISTKDTFYHIPDTEKNGWIVSVYSPHYSISGDIIGVIGIVTDITERKLIEEKLKKINEQLEGNVLEKTKELKKANYMLKSIFESLNQQSFWSVDLQESKFLYISPGTEKVYGYSTETFKNNHYLWKEVVHPDDLYITEKMDQQTWQGQPTDSEMRIIHSDNSVHWIRAQTMPVFDSDGKVIYVNGMTIDITEQKLSEQLLKESEAKKRALINAIPDIMFTLSKEGVFLDYKAPDGSKLDLSPEQLLGKSIYELLSGITDESMYYMAKEVIYLINKALETREIQIFEYQLSLNDVVHDWEARIVAGGDDEVIFIIRDITDRKKSEVQIYEQAALLDKAQDAIIVRDLDYNVIYWNKSAERLYGWTKAEILNKYNNEQFYLEKTDELIEAQNSILQKGEWIGELKQSTKSGNEIIVQSRWNLIHDKSGRPKSILTVNTDITEKKRMETQFLRAQRMESIGTLTGGIAHDLNNVLAPIMMAVDILKMDLSDKKRKSILSTLESSVKRGSDIIKQLLIFARGDAGKEHTTVDIYELTGNITQIIKSTFPKSIILITTIPDNLWSVTGDITQLEQMLLNLCVNARDAMPDGGILNISAENILIDESSARMNIDAKVGHYVLITLTDTGTGIAPEIIDKIFEPFFTTKEIGKGTGLGLSSLTGIIKSHKGFVNLISKVGEGTMFKVYLPAEKSMKIEQTEDEQLELLRGNGQSILVVDDEVYILEILKTTLETFGYNVLTASNGMEAIKIYKENKNMVKVILTDVSMPVMDGLTTTKALRQIDPLVKVIITSGLTSSQQVSEASGNNENFPEGTLFLHKPYTTADLLKKIKDIL